ncbi:MAG: hypothetical protein QXP04_00280 [Candidatus Nanoarchaeia archaeon]|nr:hypothetical protein [Candidatus Jingweiarchaeum tengchongense]
MRVAYLVVLLSVALILFLNLETMKMSTVNVEYKILSFSPSEPYSSRMILKAGFPYEIISVVEAPKIPETVIYEIPQLGISERLSISENRENRYIFKSVLIPPDRIGKYLVRCYVMEGGNIVASKDGYLEIVPTSHPSCEGKFIVEDNIIRTSNSREKVSSKVYFDSKFPLDVEKTRFVFVYDKEYLWAVGNSIGGNRYGGVYLMELDTSKNYTIMVKFIYEDELIDVKLMEVRFIR